MIHDNFMNQSLWNFHEQYIHEKIYMNIHEHSWINVFMNTKFMFYMEMHDDAWKFHEPKFMKFSWIINSWKNLYEYSRTFMN